MEKKKIKKVPLGLAALTVLTYVLPWFDLKFAKVYGFDMLNPESTIQTLSLIVFVIAIIQGVLSFRGKKQSFYLATTNLLVFVLFFIILFTAESALAEFTTFGIFIAFLLVLVTFLLSLRGRNKK